jgi:hypothetical protein
VASVERIGYAARFSARTGSYARWPVRPALSRPGLVAGLDAVVEPARVGLVALVGLGGAVPLDVAPAADGVL